MTNPVIGFIRTCFMFMFRKFQFDDEVVNKKIIMNDGSIFTVFRRVIVKRNKTVEPQAYFLVRFRPRHVTPDENIKFSKKPMMIFMGFSGFCSKIWAVDYKTGLCQGLYEWEKVEDAENYSKSIAMKFMANRSDPDTVIYKIVDKRKESIEFEII